SGVEKAHRGRSALRPHLAAALFHRRVDLSDRAHRRGRAAPPGRRAGGDRARHPLECFDSSAPGGGVSPPPPAGLFGSGGGAPAGRGGPSGWASPIAACTSPWGRGTTTPM